KNSPGPSADWIKIVKSGHARNKIRAFLQKRDQQDRKDRVHQGQQMLEDELRRLKGDAKDLDIRKVESILSSLSLKSADDLFAGLADRKISLQAVTDRLIRNKPGAVDDEEIMKIYNRAAGRSHRTSECGVVVPGIDTIQVSLANCCSPIPGDAIIGYISKGQGV
ncbi:RelA/SpoT AH/RIS domain-containing protein, partial [Faecalibaculum rodentium]